MPEEQSTTSPQEVQKTEVVTGKAVLSFKLPTPMWATWIFRAEFILNKAATMYLAGTGMIEPERVKEYLLIMSIVDFLTWLSARAIGIKKDAIQAELEG